MAAVGAFQFPVDARRGAAREVARLRRGLERFDRDVTVEVEPLAREASLRSLGRRRAEVAKWLSARPPLQVDVAAHIEGQEVSPLRYWLVEEFFVDVGSTNRRRPSAPPS